MFFSQVLLFGFASLDELSLMVSQNVLARRNLCFSCPGLVFVAGFSLALGL